MEKTPLSEQRIDAVWTRDSETGDWVLIDKLTNTIVIRQKERPANAS